MEETGDNQKDLGAAAERVNAGAPIAPVDASLLEHTWEARRRLMASLPPPKPGTATGLFAVAGGGFDPSSMGADQQVGFMMRHGLLDALVDRGILEDYMNDPASRKKVFAAAASVPLTKGDLGEAMAERLLRDMPPEMVEKAREEFAKAGYDPNHLKIVDKFLAWMRENS